MGEERGVPDENKLLSRFPLVLKRDSLPWPQCLIVATGYSIGVCRIYQAELHFLSYFVAGLLPALVQLRSSGRLKPGVSDASCQRAERNPGYKATPIGGEGLCYHSLGFIRTATRVTDGLPPDVTT